MMTRNPSGTPHSPAEIAADAPPGVVGDGAGHAEHAAQPRLGRRHVIERDAEAGDHAERRTPSVRAFPEDPAAPAPGRTPPPRARTPPTPGTGYPPVSAPPPSPRSTPPRGAGSSRSSRGAPWTRSDRASCSRSRATAHWRSSAGGRPRWTAPPPALPRQRGPISTYGRPAISGVASTMMSPPIEISASCTMPSLLTSTIDNSVGSTAAHAAAHCGSFANSEPTTNE